jgi:hypothetical protein
MEKVFINICEQGQWISTPKTYLKAYKDLYNSEKIITHIFYIWDMVNNEEYIFLVFHHCSHSKELESEISKLYKNNHVVYINTFTEWLIELTNTVKKNLWEEITKQHECFRDKSLQRKFLQDYNPELAIKYINSTPDAVDIFEIWEYLWYPYIVKPSSWIQSAGVAIITSQKDLEKYMKEYDIFLKKFNARGFNNETLLFEEFIDGRMFSIDYFVDKNWFISMSPPVEVKLGTDIWIDDFMNYARSFRESKISSIDKKQLEDFITWSISALWIKNTFLHHEFKITSTGKLKTIEINGRIGWYRLEMIQESLNYNWLRCVIWWKDDLKLQNNFTSFLVYPEQKCVLKWFNEELFSEIEKLESIYFINKLESFIWKEIWLTSQWFTKVAIIKIKNSDSQRFEEDYSFIEKNFKNLLIIE